MSLRPDPTDPAGMAPTERSNEVASILARGILRLHERILPNVPGAENPERFSPTCLDLSALSRPCVRAG